MSSVQCYRMDVGGMDVQVGACEELAAGGRGIAQVSQGEAGSPDGFEVRRAREITGACHGASIGDSGFVNELRAQWSNAWNLATRRA